MSEDKPTPICVYPVGTVASFGGKTATVLSATLESDGWHYTVEIDAGMLIPNFCHAGTEAELRRLLAEQMGKSPGPAYPEGLDIRRGQAGGRIAWARKAEDGRWFYAYLSHVAQPLAESQIAAQLAKGAF